jgi:large subunit ribosomal protein L10
MPTEAKQATVAELTALFAAAPTTIVTDYRGLTVSEIGAVRRALRERGVTYRVVKNRLARIAAQQAGIGELAELLDGPSAIAVGEADEAALAKALIEAVRPYKTVEVRGALIRGQRVDRSAVDTLATLPSRDVLLAQLAGAMSAPMSMMVGLLAAPLRGLGGGLQQLLEQRGPETAEPAAAAEAATPAAATAAAATTEAAPEAAPAEGGPVAAAAAQAEPAEAPAAEAETPAAETESPAAEAEAPAAEAESPAAEADATTPAVEAATPDPEASTPEAEASTPEASGADTPGTSDTDTTEAETPTDPAAAADRPANG